MAAQKACKNCKAIVEGDTCSKCGSRELADNFKGKLAVLNPEQSEIANHLKIKEKGNFAVKIG